MIGIIVAAHGHLATELIATAELIVGELPNVTGCNISPALSPQGMEEELERAVARVEQGEGVVILADLLGGTPCSRSMALCHKVRVEVVTGANLPMVLKAHSLRKTHSLRELARQLVDSVRSSIRWVSDSEPSQADLTR
jgi:PTS system mannose-specific IIA component